jgi:type IV secretion system protein VirB11
MENNILETTRQKTLDFFNNSLGVVKKYLDDHDVTDIMLNPDGSLWLDTFSCGQIQTGDKLSWHQAEQIIRLASGIKGKYFNEANPSVATELMACGSRFHGVMPPQSAYPIFTIRKKPAKIFSLEDYVKENILTKEQYKHIKMAVAARRNILIAGSTGSGKTTFANAVLKEVATLNVRVAILEDTCELQCSSVNHYKFNTTEQVTMQKLLKDTLRMNIDTIVVGEVRGQEALHLLKAWNTGHSGGVATIHSDSALDALYRLEQLILEVSSNCQRHLISKAINMVIFLAKNSLRKRFVQEILQVEGLVHPVTPYKVVKC